MTTPTTIEGEPSGAAEQGRLSLVGFLRSRGIAAEIVRQLDVAVAARKWTAITVGEALEQRGSLHHEVEKLRALGDCGRAEVNRALDELRAQPSGCGASPPMPASATPMSRTVDQHPGIHRTLDFLDEQAIPRRLRTILRARFAGELARFERLDLALAAHQEFAIALRDVPGVGRTAARAVMNVLRDPCRLQSFLDSRAAESRTHSPTVHTVPPSARMPVELSVSGGSYPIQRFEEWIEQRDEESLGPAGFGPEEKSALVADQLRQEVVRRRIAQAEFLQLDLP